MRKETELPIGKPSAFASLKHSIIACQKQLANYLNWRCRNLSPKCLLALLILFCALSGAYLLKVIVQAVH